MRALHAESLRQHLIGELLPLWARHAADPASGAWFGRLTHALEPLRHEPRRLLVQARLLWAFSEGVRLGGDGALADAAVRAREGLTGFADPSDDGSYWLTRAPDGAPLDRTRDLYAHAFVVLALAHHGAVCADPGSVDAAVRTHTWIGARLSDPRAGGFFERVAADGRIAPAPRRQNPHMHLLEALLALDAARPDPAVRRDADALVELLGRRFVDVASGALREHFDASWAPLRGADGEAIEPGHHFEWVWLLEEHRRARAAPAAGPLAERLWSFGVQHGLDSDGLVLDAVDPQGAPRRTTKRLWPQTEHLKACIARADLTAAADFLERMRAAYLDPATGGWIEHLDRERRPLSGAMNATSVYHVTLALSSAIGSGG